MIEYNYNKDNDIDKRIKEFNDSKINEELREENKRLEIINDNLKLYLGIAIGIIIFLICFYFLYEYPKICKYNLIVNTLSDISDAWSDLDTESEKENYIDNNYDYRSSDLSSKGDKYAHNINPYNDYYDASDNDLDGSDYINNNDDIYYDDPILAYYD